MREIAKILLKLKAVTLSPEDPYTWASGIKSPIYCDNRLTLSYPEDRSTVEKGLVDLIKDQYPEVQYIMGTATAGIPHAAIIADKMGLPMGFVRSSNKDHGKQNKIEGAKIEGAKVVVIEDLFSTGGSSIEAAKALEEVGYEVLGIVSIFTYNMKNAEENFKAAGFKHHSLTNFDELIEVAHEMDYIKESEIEKLKLFRDNPKDSSWMNA
ncbi:orotate phosphoribosyltransferase [Peptoniphilus harei ACS-146-V-Sch2b]|uniref:Orotate phosphoribosyltransferase n=1 Tax=Peptoniphilus harei ACS-146-V-Sch2b TaxID=908338 RepID=E4KXT4_9FIRM|nr:orotate phosphoribosyltransferase [Peptoniphilus harei]EFR33318.1 orotate phosphoribosyltransferase [Peptoniphilus harei ACS-146-V-Sch2b]MDU5324581.1 orotate phosphoribosyltransferase [Peptoniphilus harei]